MRMVLLTALGVGGATVAGAFLGLAFQKISHKFSDIVLSFAAGIMLCASIVGLIIPAVESTGSNLLSIAVVVFGIFCGAFVLNLMDKLVPHLHRIVGLDYENHPQTTANVSRILLFVMAIAIHNFPEGIAAGVGFGADNPHQALTIAGGIALQNIPEGMVIIAPMLSAGIGKKQTFLAAASTGFVEVAGTLLGYFAVSLSTAILPFSLAFAGGTMLYIISDEMIPETHSHGNERASTYSLLVGFCVMLLVDLFL